MISEMYCPDISRQLNASMRHFRDRAHDDVAAENFNFVAINCNAKQVDANGNCNQLQLLGIENRNDAGLTPAKVPQRMIKLDSCRYSRCQQMRIVVSAKVQHMLAMIARHIFSIGRRGNDFIRSCD